MIDNSKKHYFLNRFENSKSCKELFETTDNLMEKQNKTPLPSGTEKELCEKFAIFFNSKIENICSCLDSVSSPPASFGTFQGSRFGYLKTVTESDVLALIRCSSAKTCDLDPTPTQMLKQCIDIILPHITVIINNSLTTGIVPDCFRHAIIKPILKKTGLKENDLKNFRPVSNLNFLSKILERVVLSHLLHHVEENELGEMFQSAYKANHSTETALLKVTSDILEDN